MAAARVAIGIELVFEARIAAAGSTVVGAAEHVLLGGGVLDDRLDHQVGRCELLDNRDPGEDRAWIGAALRREPVEAVLDRAERPVGRARKRIVQRDPPARRRDDLGDPATHLPRPDDEDVREARVGHA